MAEGRRQVASGAVVDRWLSRYQGTPVRPASERHRHGSAPHTPREGCEEQEEGNQDPMLLQRMADVVDMEVEAGWEECARGAEEICTLAELLAELVAGDGEKLAYATTKNEDTADTFLLGHCALAEAQKLRIRRWGVRFGLASAMTGAGLGLLVGGPIGLAVGGVGSWLAGGAAVGGGVAGASGAMTGRMLERRSQRAIDETLVELRVRRARLAALGEGADACGEGEPPVPPPAADLEGPPKARVAAALSRAARISTAVHEQLCRDFRCVLQNRELVAFHERVEELSDQLLTIGPLRPGGLAPRQQSPAVPATRPGENIVAEEEAAASVRLQAGQRAGAVGQHISALIANLKDLHRGIGRLVDGQLGELDDVLDATLRCTTKATALVKHMAQVHGERPR